MVSLTIDGKQVEVAEGTTVMAAAEKVGIKVPRLCHHPNLTPYGGCRLCMVEVEGARILQPSCTLPVSSNMVVHTDTTKVQTARKFILSMLFSERNHFCMFCQETDGDCELQCAAYAENMNHWPLTPNYSPFALDASHPYIAMDGNRCILCRRCVRTCAELVGNFTLGFEERGASSFLVADNGVPLGESTCISCGACVQNCPTGALIDRRSAYLGRETDLDHHKSVCTQCSVGCVRDVLTRDNRLVRLDGDQDALLNRGLLCEAGRYTALETQAERIQTPLLMKNGQQVPASWEEALSVLGSQMKSAGARSCAAAASAALPAETLAAFKHTFADGFGLDSVCLSDDDACASLAARAAAALGAPFEAKLEALKDIETVLIIGADLESDNQVAGFFLKRQLSNETRLITADCEPNQMMKHSALRLALEPGSWDAFVSAFIAAWQTAADVAEAQPVECAAAWMKQASKRVIVLGKHFASTQNYAAFLKLVTFAHENDIPLVVIKAKANSLAAAQLGYQASVEAATPQLAFLALGDEQASAEATEQWEITPFLAVYAAHPSALTARAQVVLPAHTWPEESGTFLSTDGRFQQKLQEIRPAGGSKASLIAVREIAAALGVSSDCDWKAAITAPISPVVLE